MVSGGTVDVAATERSLLASMDTRQVSRAGRRVRRRVSRSAKVLFAEIRRLGYRGSMRLVARYIAGRRTAEPPSPSSALLPGPRTLAWLLLRRPCDLDETEQRSCINSATTT